MIYLLDRNQIISHSVNKSEIHPALSETAKFISLSIDIQVDVVQTTTNKYEIRCISNLKTKRAKLDLLLADFL